MTALLQPTLTGGELSPELWGRVDAAVYQKSVRRMRNFVVRPSGGAENRNGLYYCGKQVTVPTDHRLIPFVYSTIISYVLFFGPNYIRFQSGGSDVVPSSTAYAVGTTYAVDVYVTDVGITYRSLQAANLAHAPVSSPTWWVADSGLQITSPYTAAQVDKLRYTQSADVLYLAHPDVPPQIMRRLTSNTFDLSQFQFQDGPFVDINADESLKVAASGVQGTVTLTASSAIFSANAVGSLFYLENKNLGQIKPWVVADRGIVIGDLRRSDGKTYKAVTVPAAGTFHETGPRQPIHENGRMWDGGGDTRSNGVDTWSSGVEWEFVDLGFGVVKITSVTDSTHAIGTVLKRLPGQVVGGVGGAANTWTRNGDGVTKVFPVAGATYGVFAVSVSGSTLTPDPNYYPGAPNNAPGADDPFDPCPVVESYIGGMGMASAGEVRISCVLDLYDPVARIASTGVVDFAATHDAPCWRIHTARGIEGDCSDSAPIWTKARGYMKPESLMGQEIMTMIEGSEPEWDVVVDLVFLGTRAVRHITVGNRNFWFGRDLGRFILHHNQKPRPF